MRRVVFSAAFTCLAIASLTGCVGDDTQIDLPDAGPTGHLPDGGFDSTAPPSDDAATPTEDGGPDAPAFSEGGGSDAGDASVDATGTPYLFLSYEFDKFTKIELSAYDLTQKKEVGSLGYPANGWGGTNVTVAGTNWVLEQGTDLALLMNVAQPWVPANTWNLAAGLPDAGGELTDPYGVAVSGTRAWVPLYERDAVAVLDIQGLPSSDGGALAPASYVDLSSLQQAADTDGTVEDMGAFYDPSTKLVWLVLQNIDQLTLACDPGRTSTIAAIDTTTGALAPGKVYTLHGVDPVSAAFDATGERLVILSAGCTQAAADDGGASTTVGRLIEGIALATGTSTVLFDATSEPYPGGLVYVDAHHAFVTFGAAYAWDPTQTTLGTVLTNAPDAFVWDGRGLLGPQTTLFADGGFEGVSIVEVVPDDAGGAVTTIGANVVSTPDSNGFWSGVSYSP